MPGHKRKGQGMFEDISRYDITEITGYDNLHHPEGIIRDSMNELKRLYHTRESWYLVNGSTVGILAAVSACRGNGYGILISRNCHKSVINGLILSGAVPIFIMPEVDKRTEIVNQISFDEWKKAIDENPDAKAIFIINPTYFGATCDLKRIVEYAHLHDKIVLVDEAHGSHFYFSNLMPSSAMEAGADMSTLSIHKTGGSLTQSSVLLVKGDRVPKYYVNKSFNLLTTTSPSSILIASLDAARKYLFFNGEEKIKEAVELAKLAKEQIDKIPGFIAHSKDYFVNECGSFSYDETKLCVEIDKLKITGFELYKLLKDKYRIQIELAETYVFLLLFTIGSTKEDVDVIVNALKDISSKYYDESIVYENHHYMSGFPEMKIRPRNAYHGPLKVCKLKDAIGKISKEMIMIYPPGIPVIIPGEVFTKEVIQEINYYLKKKATILSDWDGANEVSVVDEDED